jgi:phosphodiesterase/alkaline phosphatase D-like protein
MVGLSTAMMIRYQVNGDAEVANNGYRDGFSNMNNTEQSFLRSGRVSVDSRKMNAVRAYFEWMPYVTKAQRPCDTN